MPRPNLNLGGMKKILIPSDTSKTSHLFQNASCAFLTNIGLGSCTALDKTLFIILLILILIQRALHCDHHTDSTVEIRLLITALLPTENQALAPGLKTAYTTLGSSQLALCALQLSLQFSFSLVSCHAINKSPHLYS